MLLTCNLTLYKDMNDFLNLFWNFISKQAATEKTYDFVSLLPKVTMNKDKNNLLNSYY